MVQEIRDDEHQPMQKAKLRTVPRPEYPVQIKDKNKVSL
jgi:hypothetical protein